MRVVFVEGVPGSGKSTMAAKLCADAGKLGFDARWYLEESHDHPVHPKTGQRSKTQGDFAEECLRSWSAFVEKEKGRQTLHILEGSAFQSTVRFMMEKSLSGIAGYFRRFEEIMNVLEPKMIYLRPSDAVDHSRYVCALRGDEWSTKVSQYLAQTDYFCRHELQGLEGMHRFWGDYARLCDSLVAETSIPTKRIDFVAGEWERHMAEAATFLSART
jgi:adenylate kinase family enzyme